jgi:hypothetical protein
VESVNRFVCDAAAAAPSWARTFTLVPLTLPRKGSAFAAEILRSTQKHQNWKPTATAHEPRRRPSASFFSWSEPIQPPAKPGRRWWSSLSCCQPGT